MNKTNTKNKQKLPSEWSGLHKKRTELVNQVKNLTKQIVRIDSKLNDKSIRKSIDNYFKGADECLNNQKKKK
jgi:hypothetical protein